MKSLLLIVIQSATQTLTPYDSHKLETHEKDAYPDLNKRITQNEAFDSMGNLLYPKLDFNPIKTEPDEWFIRICDTKRSFTIPKECCTLVNSWMQGNTHEICDQLNNDNGKEGRSLGESVKIKMGVKQ